MSKREELFRAIPSVESLLNAPTITSLISRTSREFVLAEIKQVIGSIRKMISEDKADENQALQAIADIEKRVAEQVERKLRPVLRPVVNATGVIIHTNLGRALLSEAAAEALQMAAQSYTNLEFDLEKGERSSRDKYISELLCEMLGCEAATVVNNNAAAVFLILNTLAPQREVIVSRGELIEIGGSFRIPEIMRRSGAILREVGTTNKTRISDYQSAINENTALILRVHPSNYRIIGFTERPGLEELVDLGRRYEIPVVEDLGSGCMLDLKPYGIGDEPVVSDSLRAGVDVACFSGDKLLGGPQAGIIVGRSKPIQAMRKNPLMRVLRVDKMTLAALEATLISYHKGRAVEEVPVLRMLAATKQQIERRVRSLYRKLKPKISPGIELTISDGFSVVGGGSCPEVRLPTKLLAIASQRMSAAQIESRLRENEPPVIARVEKEQVLLDLRTVLPEQERTIIEACAKL